MNCDVVSELYAAYLDNEVTPEERTQVDNHLCACDKCREELTLLGATQNSLRQVLKSTAEEIEPSPQAWDAVRSRIESPGSFWKRLIEFLNSPGMRMAVPVAVLVLLAAGLIWHAGIFSSPTQAPSPVQNTPPQTPTPTVPPPVVNTPPPPTAVPAAPPPGATPPPVVTNDIPKAPPVVNVAPGQVTVQPPNVTVNPPQVTVQQPPPAQVTIQPPGISVQPPPPAQVTVTSTPPAAIIPAYLYLWLLLPVGLAIALTLAVVWPKKKKSPEKIE